MNRSVFITGGSRGIGAEIVRLFSENGYRTAFTYRYSADSAGFLSCEYGADAIRADSAEPGDIARACEKVLSLFTPDILINNAGISYTGLLTDMTDEQLDEITDINFKSAILYSKHILPEMIRRKSGKIINISSMWGITGASCEVAYSATKAGIIGFTKALAKEVGPSGITVNCIAPGVIDTDMNCNLSREDINYLKDETPLGRIGSVTDVANTALFLASDSADFITGEVINVSGGFVI